MSQMWGASHRLWVTLVSCDGGADDVVTMVGC